ncbi:MAG TPA: chemotaxis protein CheA [Verrucomicrobia bacterium]|nr:chemotaxis protein CheA [Verrucomicrobiota bacterium]
MSDAGLPPAVVPVAEPVAIKPTVERGQPVSTEATAPKAPEHKHKPPAETKAAGDAAAKATGEAGGTMKVDASRIDLLLDTIGELVIAEAIVAGDPEIQAIKSLRLEKNLALLGKITRSLQDMGMSMRLVPIDPVFRKMARLVRDLSHKSGKKVDLKIEGGETELDKSMVDKLGDPLVHMIRNSMDHGIESAEDRLAAGKPRSGTITLRAYHKGGNIHIDIEDDGRGLNRDAIVAKAIERGLIRSGEGMADSDVFAMIFEAGFSTAAKVTELSGRGVGMDVVLRNIESLRGAVFTRSTPGAGTIFTLSLPLTTAIIDGMLARVGQETFILPTLSVLESFRPTASQLHPVSGHGEMVSFRDSLLPLFRLGRILHVPNAGENPLDCIIMVVEEMGKQWGLMVDELLGQQQVVIKNLGDGVGAVPGVAGASILADGRPGLILDVGAIVRLATT